MYKTKKWYLKGRHSHLTSCALMAFSMAMMCRFGHVDRGHGRGGGGKGLRAVLATGLAEGVVEAPVRSLKVRVPMPVRQLVRRDVAYNLRGLSDAQASQANADEYVDDLKAE